MARQPRKSPEKKKKKKPVPRAPGLILRILTNLGTTIGRNPSIAGGSVAFVVVFSFVSANALWYQRGEHPSPLFRTRDAQHPNAFSGQRPQVEPSGAVTTFKIERPDGTETASIDDRAGLPDTAGTAAASPLVRDVQQQLTRRGLYDGAADGVIGPRTAAAILFFEESTGLPLTGEATPTLLAALKSNAEGKVVLPGQRPNEDVTSNAAAADPVAAAILQAEKQVPEARSAAAADVEMVMNIQRGLINLAYADIRIDGVAGGRTRDAIRHFEKHYRLPASGEPRPAILKKMKEIGAL